MNLVLIPTANWQPHERLVLPWGVHRVNGCVVFRTGRGWCYADESKNEASDLRFGDVVNLGGTEYEVQIES